MKKTNSLELLKWLFWTVLSAYILAYTTVLILDFIFPKVPKELYSIFPYTIIAATFYIFYRHQLDRLHTYLPLKQKRGLKATNARSIKVNGTHNIFLSSVRSILPSQALQPPSELLYWQYGSYIIKEDMVYEWLRKGWNRQLVGEPHPFSGNWMTTQYFYSIGRTKMKRECHEALVNLAFDYGLWLKHPKQGNSGMILASPAGCLAKLKGRWDN